MRIGCAACGHTHDSDVTPFSHNVVREDYFQSEEVPKYSEGSKDYEMMVHHNKGADAEFLCGNCNTVNNVFLKWNATRSKEEAENEST